MSDSNAKGIKAFLERVRLFYVKWGVPISFCAVVFAVGAKRFSLIKGNEVEIVAATAVILLLSEQIKETLKLITEKQNEVIKESQSQQQNLKSFIDKSDQKLLNLRGVVSDLQIELSNIPVTQKLVVRHIGLDMTHAWDYVQPFLKNDRHMWDMDYRLLVLTDDETRLGDVDVEILQWCRSVNASINRMNHDVKTIHRHYLNRNIPFEFSCKKYICQPYVHGIMISGAINVCYFSIGRWDEDGRYCWGESQYYKVSPTSIDSINRDLHEVFLGTFNKYWNSTETEEFSFSNKPTEDNMINTLKSDIIRPAPHA